MPSPRWCPYFYDVAANHFYAAFGAHYADADGKVVCSFYRFASVSRTRDADTRAVMENGAFTGCQLYDGTAYVPWGMGDDTAVSVWTVHPTCVELAYDGTTNAFTIRY